MINDRTLALGLPLPHPDNLLEHDVQRLREASQMLDRLLAPDTRAVIERDNDGNVIAITTRTATGERHAVLTRSNGRVIQITTTGNSIRRTVVYLRTDGKISGYEVTEEAVP